MNWPWTNLYRKLVKLDKEDLATTGVVVDVDSLFDDLKNYKPSFFERIWNKIYFAIYNLTWNVYRFFNPCHSRLRKAIPRRWNDLSELTLSINFEIIKSFVEEEMHMIDWNSNDAHKEVSAWLNASYKYITEERNQLQEDFSRALTDSTDNKRELPYSERYAEPNRIEALIDEKDKSILIGLATHRQFLWS